MNKTRKLALKKHKRAKSREQDRRKQEVVVKRSKTGRKKKTLFKKSSKILVMDGIEMDRVP